MQQFEFIKQRFRSATSRGNQGSCYVLACFFYSADADIVHTDSKAQAPILASVSAAPDVGKDTSPPVSTRRAKDCSVQESQGSTGGGESSSSEESEEECPALCDIK